ncbi:MAG: c-type cytochrome [Actinomycetota bacterium]|nr:c-type cytochrome [Actinomycetota bacterium]
MAIATDQSAVGRSRATRRRGIRRRLGATAVLLAALASMGGAYAAFATTSGASDTTSSAQDIAAGKQLFDVSCITCHGANLQGVQNRGVPLLGVGAAAAYFQISTGRMPLVGQGPEATRKTSTFSERQIEQIAAYIQSVGGGPALPQGDLRDSNIAAGGELFRLNCAACHGTTGKGAPLSAGKSVPALNQATDLQVITAMLSGPESMPIFSDNQLSPTQKRQIVSYIQTLKASKDPGGNGIDRIGPVSEALVVWVGGVGALMIAILWIGVKSQ